MILNVKPIAKIQGSFHLPASKSYSIRAFFVAACGGVSSIVRPSNCQDAIVAMRMAKALGCDVRQESLDTWIVDARQIKRGAKRFDVGESGTSLRFILPLLALHVNSAQVLGKGTLVGRPNAHLCETLRAMGLKIQGTGDKESVPVLFKGGQIKGGSITIDGSLSSQFISALLIALPCLTVDSLVHVTGKEMVSRDYIVMTRQILAKAGIAIKVRSQRDFAIKANQTFKGLKNFTVPSDYGLAAFALAACALIPSKVTMRGYLPDDLVQSDAHIMTFLKRMSVQMKHTRRGIAIQGPFVLKSGTFSLKDCPDLVPIMAVLAMFAKGETRLVDIHHARAKESDRISDLRNELIKTGADIRETSNSLIIRPRAQYQSNQKLFAHHDHRLAMAFTVLGLKIGCKVDGIESCRKSYPDFVRDFKSIGALS